MDCQVTKKFLLIAQLPALASESCHLDRLADVLPPDNPHLHHHNLHPVDWLAQQRQPHHAGGGKEECHCEGTNNTTLDRTFQCFPIKGFS